MKLPPLPELPEPAITGDSVLDGYLDPDAEYTADQLREYALAYGWAVRQACAKEAESPRHIPLDALGSEMMTSVLRRYFGAIAAAIRSQEGE